MITGVHHVCVKCRPEELEKVQKFYGSFDSACQKLGWSQREGADVKRNEPD